MSFVFEKASKKLFEKHLEQYAPKDAMYEFYTDKKGKQKRKKRPLPPDLSPRDAKILQSVRRRAHYLDKGFHILGFRFGWTFLIGLVPVLGDAMNAGLNYYLVVRKARQAEPPAWIVQRMLFNMGLSTGVGLVPFVGDVAVAVWKTNSRNAALLEEVLRLRGEEFIRLNPEDGQTIELSTAMSILSVNAGSSSLKVSLFKRTDSVTLEVTCTISSITSPPAFLTLNGSTTPLPASIASHASAFTHILSQLPSPLDSISHICHRVVHGGSYSRPVLIDQDAYDHIAALSALAPLHNASALDVIRACLESMPHAKSIAFFDTVFHNSIPKHISAYAIDQTLATERGLRKYGFHGLSYAYILRSVSTHLSRPASSLNLIALHLASGASVCAIRAGRSLDTSMGLTPLSGLPGATRAGGVDPALVFHYTKDASANVDGEEEGEGEGDGVHRLHVTQAEEVLNKQCGWKAVTGTADFGRIVRGRDSDKGLDKDACTLAFDILLDRILDSVGAYHLKLGGEVDALVFAGGIGERSVELREAVIERVQCLGYARIDKGRNEAVGRGQEEGESVVDIGVQGSGKRVLVCRTDEQLEMARACALDEEFWK
ncbi:hypothetical protein DXG01_014896 [Tephrocybe rancida]|nr:hypothetical protein DXG01_014896 [Tephrocybe rancida]